MAKKSVEQLFDEVKKSVKAQDEALKALCTSMWLHGHRVEYKKVTGKNGIKQNILLIGRSGTGKTLMLRKIAEVLGIPIVIEDATAFTGTGWKGRSVEEALTNLWVESNRDINRAETGIVVFDEIDKVVHGSKVEPTFTPINIMLKLIEGTKVEFPIGLRDEKKTMDTSNILFICAGAFEGIEEIVETRENQNSLGFGGKLKGTEEEKRKLLQKVTRDDLIAYGVGTQFLGRFSLLTALNPLDEKDLADILCNSDESVVKGLHSMLLETEGVGLTITKQAAEKIAEQALKEQSGARALSGIISELLQPYLFQVALDEKISKLKIKQNAGEVIVVLEEGKRKSPKTVQKKVRVRPEDVPLVMAWADEEDEENGPQVLADQILDEGYEQTSNKKEMGWKDMRAAHFLLSSLLDCLYQQDQKYHNCLGLLRLLSSILQGLYIPIIKGQTGYAEEWLIETETTATDFFAVHELVKDAVEGYVDKHALKSKQVVELSKM